MNEAVTYFFALALGLVAAVPVGAIQIEVVRRSMAGRIGEARMVVIGAATVDSTYGIIALSGVAPLLQHVLLTPLLQVAGGALIMLIGVLAIRDSRTAPAKENNLPEAHGGAYLRGVSLAAANPLTMFWWLAGFKFAVGLHIVPMAGATTSAAFLAGGISGMMSYLFLVTRIAHAARTRVVARSLQLVHRWCGVVLIAVGALMSVRAIVVPSL